MSKLTPRHLTIINILHSEKKIEVAKLAERLGVSQVTIRKDLDFLEKKRGLLKREHGYAVSIDSEDMENRLSVHYQEKQRIAKLAAACVEDNETVMIESGSCCALLALELAETKKNITIITNSVFIANFVRNHANLHIILLGGDYQERSGVTIGPIVHQTAQLFFVDKLFVGTDGYRAGVGFTGSDAYRTETVRNMAKSARQTIVLTESSKFSAQGVMLQFKFDEVAKVYTDNRLAETEKRALAAEGLVIEYAAIDGSE